MFARRAFVTASRVALASTKRIGARSYHIASTVESSSKRYFLLGGAALLAGYGLVEANKSRFVVNAAEKVPYYGAPGTSAERTFIAVKPDGVQRGLIGDVIGRFEQKGYKLVAIKVIRPTKDFASQHYADLKTKPFFGGLVEFFSSGPVVAMVWEGPGVIKGGRRLVGATDPNAAEDGSLRGDFCIEVGRNIVHGSDGPESAVDEIKLWFKEEEVTSYNKTIDQWVFGSK